MIKKILMLAMIIIITCLANGCYGDPPKKTDSAATSVSTVPEVSIDAARQEVKDATKTKTPEKTIAKPLTCTSCNGTGIGGKTCSFCNGNIACWSCKGSGKRG